MRLILGLLLTTTFLVLSGCETKHSERTAVAPADSEKLADKQQSQLAEPRSVSQVKSSGLNQPTTTNVSFNEANAANEASQTVALITRVVIRRLLRGRTAATSAEKA